MSWKRRPGGSPPTLWWVLIFDCGRGDVRRGRLDDVGVERALGEEVDLAHRLRLRLEDGDELATDDASLLFRVDHTAQRLQEPVGGVDVADVHVQVAVHDCEDALGLLLAQEAVVDEDARELVADRAMHERRRDRRVDAAGQRADHATVADLGADALDRLGDEGARRSRWARSGRRGTGSCAGPRARSACARPRDGTGCRTRPCRSRRPRPASCRSRRGRGSRAASC